MIYSAGKLFYNYRTLAQKVLSRHYGKDKIDESTFKEYQQSVYDLMRPYINHREIVIRTLSTLFQMSENVVEVGCDALCNFTHANPSAFQKMLAMDRRMSTF
jgi:hypothetical protein